MSAHRVDMPANFNADRYDSHLRPVQLAEGVTLLPRPTHEVRRVVIVIVLRPAAKGTR